MPGGGDYLPPVIAEFKANVKDFIARVDEAMAKLEEFKAAARGEDIVVRVRTDTSQADRGFSDAKGRAVRSGEDVGRAYGESVNSGMRKSRADLKREAEIAADLASSSFINRFRGNWRQLGGDKLFSGGGSGSGGSQGGFAASLLPGGGRGTASGRAGVAGLGLLAGVPAAAGLAFPLVGALTTAGSAAAASAPLFGLLKDAMNQVSTAAGTLEKQQNAYNAAEQQTVMFLHSSNTAWNQYQTLLGQVTPGQRNVLQLLLQQNVAWNQLTPAQQANLVSLRDNAALWKALPKSMQDQVTALLAQQKAFAALQPAQTQAVQGYVNMRNAWDNLRNANMPGMFGIVAAAEKVAVDAMRPIQPMLTAMEGAWRQVFLELDHGVQSPGYSSFIAFLTRTGPPALLGIARGAGNVALGLGRIWMALEPLQGNFLKWLDDVTAKFAAWANTPAGMQHIINFMTTIEHQGPLTMRTLGDLVRDVGDLLALFARNQDTLLIIDAMAKALGGFMRNPWGAAIVEIIGFTAAIAKLGQALKVLEILKGLIVLVKSFTLALRGEAAAEAAAGAAGAAGGASAAARGGGALAGAGRLGGSAAAAIAGSSAATAAAITAGAALVVGALVIFGKHMQAASDAQAGVMRHNGGVLTAAASANGFEVSKAFQTVVNNLVAGGRQMTTSNQWSLQFAQAATQDNNKVRDAMGLLSHTVNQGQSNFAQQVGIFEAAWGGDIASIGRTVQNSGKSLSTTVNTTMEGVFSNMSQQSKVSWSGYQRQEAQASTAAFQAMNTKSKQDYQALQQAVGTYIDDAKNHQQAKQQQDTQALLAATTRFMTDANNKTILVSQQQINKLGLDVQKFYADMARGDTAAAQRDIQTMATDLAKAYQGATQSIIGEVTRGMSSAQQQAVALANKLGMNLNSLFNNGGSNPFSTGNGSKAANGTAKGLGGLATGGQVSGPGDGTRDTIPMMLANDEFVVNAHQTRKFLPLLHAINNGTLRGMAGGGQVSYDPFMQGNIWMTMGSIFPPAIAAEATAAKQVALLKQFQQMLSSVGGSAGAVGPAFAIAMALTGVSGADWLSGLEIIAKFESGFNPNAINLTDSNAAAGDPSRGLMQTIMSTFLAYHQAGTSFNIFDPVANIAAAINYIRARYGSIDNVPGVRSVRSGGGYLPYDNGGWLMPGMGSFFNGTGQPEAVLTGQQWQALMNLTQGFVSGSACGEIHIYIDGKPIHATVRKTELHKRRRNPGGTWSPNSFFE